MTRTISPKLLSNQFMIPHCIRPSEKFMNHKILSRGKHTFWATAKAASSRLTHLSMISGTSEMTP